MKHSTPFLRNNWKLVAVTLIVFYTISSLQAQDYQTDDTVHVQEVVISGESISRFQSGAKIEKIPVGQFNMAQDGNLEQLLSRTTPISLKANAGGLSTIRVRGTAPDHTSLNFGGININSLTLGHANMSNVPMYLFDEIGIQYGSSSSVNGSGSIGGAIHLGIKNSWTKGFKAEARAAHGSFGEQLYGTKIFLGNSKFESVTRAYYYYKTNDFKFNNTVIKDFETGIVGVADTQKNANIENMGILQELNYRFANKEFITTQIWLENDWRLAQQNMATNYKQPNKKEPSIDNNIRIWTKYQNRKNPFKYQLAGGYVYDYSVHNNDYESKIQTQRLIGESYIEHDFKSNASYKIGTKAMRITPKVYAYSTSLKHEDRIDLYASYYHSFFNKLKATVNIRKGFVTNYTVPFTPAIGVNYIAISKENYILSINGNIAKSYRVATFNDRFWDAPGFKGNPDIAPESGINFEFGTKWNYCSEHFNSTIKINTFYMDVDDWVLWLPYGAGWTVKNEDRVISKGIEFMGSFSKNYGKINIKSGLNYSLTSTQRIEDEDDPNNSALNRQLEYVPLHSGNIYSTTSYKKLNITIDGSYTHEQYTDENETKILDPFFLLNIAFSYKLKLNSNNKFIINAMLNNILNKDYQSYYGYAMPGINYRISLTYNFK